MGTFNLGLACLLMHILYCVCLQMHVRLRVGRLMETLGPHSRNWRYTLHDIKEATGDLPAALRK